MVVLVLQLGLESIIGTFIYLIVKVKVQGVDVVNAESAHEPRDDAQFGFQHKPDVDRCAYTHT